MFWSSFVETRLRAQERLLSNLRGEDEIDEATQHGFEYPLNTSNDIHEALQAIAEIGAAAEVEEQGEEEEEELFEEWDECLDEDVDTPF